jgi:hypothetical protein
MKFYGNAELQQNYLVDAVIPLDTSFPQSPVVGQIVFNNGVLYICIQINNGLPIWCPLTQQLTAYTYSTATPSTSWDIIHPLNTSNLSVTVYDTNNYVVIPGDIEIISNTEVLIEFGSAFAGSAVLLTGMFDAQAMPLYAYEFYQTSPSTTWTITHNLGRYPIVRVFVGNEEVQPEQVTFTSLNIVTLTFSTAQVGQAKLI